MTTSERLDRQGKTCFYRILGETFRISDAPEFGIFWTKVEGKKALKSAQLKWPDRTFSLELIKQTR